MSMQETNSNIKEITSVGKTKKSRKVIRNIFKILIFIIIVCIVYYIVAFNDTNKLADYLRDVMQGNVSYEEVEGTRIEGHYLKNFYNADSIDVEFHRVFVLHNFSDGYMWCYSAYRIYDEDGNIISSSGDMDWLKHIYAPLSYYKIHKENGEWKVVDMYCPA